MNLKAFYNLSYGVYIVSTLDGERPTGCVANSVMQITSELPLIALSINHDNFTNPCIAKTKRFCINVLGEKINPLILGLFGFRSGKDFDKFKTVKYEIKQNMPVLSEGCAYFTCELVGKTETATHTVFIGKVIDADVISSDTPMTYSYYQRVIKAKTPKNAPTYIKENK